MLTIYVLRAVLVVAAELIPFTCWHALLADVVLACICDVCIRFAHVLLADIVLLAFTCCLQINELGGSVDNWKELLQASGTQSDAGTAAAEAQQAHSWFANLRERRVNLLDAIKALQDVPEPGKLSKYTFQTVFDIHRQSV
jgi:hypothetical protein